MPVKKFFLAIGQSNAAPTAYASTWYNYHPEQDLRSAPDFTYGSYDDMYTIPGSWHSSVNTTVNLRGKAMQKIKFLTMYCPIASGYTSYPGTLKVASVDGTNPTTKLITQQKYYTSLSAGTTVVRKRTGVTHTISNPTTTTISGTIYGVVDVSPSMSPAPSIGEEFTLLIKLPIAASGTTVTLPVKFTNYFGPGGSEVASLAGLEIEYISGSHNGNIGVRKKIVSVNTSTSAITIDSSFNTDPHAGDVISIVPPKLGGVSVPIDKWGYFLPWCPFEGQVTEATFQPSPKINPYPPGFNFPNQYGVPTFFYNPFNGVPFLVNASYYGMSFAIGLTSKLQQAIGEDVYCVPLAVGSTQLAYTERGNSSVQGVAWFDPSSNNHWAPGEPGSLYNRLLDTLDAAKTAAAQQGDTLDCIGVFMIQGEGDASSEATALCYYDNLKSFKSLLRNAIQSKGLSSVAANKIPWISSNIYHGWETCKIINKQIDRLASEDVYMETFDVQDVSMQTDIGSSTVIHFGGDGLVEIERRCVDAWKRIQTNGVSDVDICNLALAHLGDTASITSIDPPDGSVQSNHCARFYPIARDGLLQMHSWLFATRRKSLDPVANYVSQWKYAYLLPEDVGDAFTIISPDSNYDYASQYNGYPISYEVSSQQYTVEVNDVGQKILYTNQEDALIRYTSTVIDTTKFSSLFVTALSWHLASMLAGPIIKGEAGSAEAKRCQQMMMMYLSQAKNSDSNQRNIKADHVVNWISGR